MQRPDSTALSAALEGVGVAGATFAEEGVGLVIRVASPHVALALSALKENDYAMLVDLTAVDTGEGIDVLYFLRSFGRDEELRVKTLLPYDGEAPSVWRVYPSALFCEREAAEMFGVSFPGHPNPKRLLTTEETGAPPLLKSTLIRTVEEVKARA